MALTKAQIIGCSDSEVKEIEVPEWGGSVFIRSINGRERGIVESWVSNGKVIDGFVNRLMLMCLSDEKGNRLFTDNDLPVIEEKNGAVLSRLATEALSVNGLSSKDFEETEKN